MSKLLNSKQAAEKLGVSVRRIQFLITNGQLKAEKVGRDYVIKESDLPKLEKRKRGRRVGSKNKTPETVKPPEVPEVPEVPKGGYSVRDAAVIVGFSRSKMWSWVTSGKIPSHKVGGHRRINEKDFPPHHDEKDLS